MRSNFKYQPNSSPAAANRRSRNRRGEYKLFMEFVRDQLRPGGTLPVDRAVRRTILVRHSASHSPRLESDGVGRPPVCRFRLELGG